MSHGEIRAVGRGAETGWQAAWREPAADRAEESGRPVVAMMAKRQAVRQVRRQRGTRRIRHSVSKINFMVKLLRACVWMPWRK